MEDGKAENRRAPPLYDMLREDLDEYMKSDEHISDMVYPFAAVGTLSDYLKIREKKSHADFPAYAVVYDPYEWIMLLDDVSYIGVDEREFFRAMQGDAEAADSVSVVLLKRVKEYDETKDQSAPIRRHITKSRALINYVIAAINESCFQHGVLPPPSLTYLISLQLCGSRSRGREKASMYQLARDVHESFFDIQGNARKDAPSMRQVAKNAGVAPSTISRRWYEICRAMDLWALAASPPEEWNEPEIPHDPDFPGRQW